ncbi:putative HTH-type transcriptional regulator [Capillimicrobium parvum]|uniref:HTH-type transcriptional regulator n=2 Tax=Capillimicrobium parvum TaxID=2884022 RepID=A0A9E6XSN4_9ACTN|nr:putative HTH-type transcriptional regulator [Capillimicrobium parvum]
MQNPWELQLDALGEYIRAQRRHANLSLRQLAAQTQISNAYLSQLERGMHEPSVRVLRSIAGALDVSVETMLAQAGLFEDEDPLTPGERGAAEAAIRADPRLTDEKKEALLAVYRSLVDGS